jgi:hypothetical protein
MPSTRTKYETESTKLGGIIDEGIRACEEAVIGIQSLTVSEAGAGEV